MKVVIVGMGKMGRAVETQLLADGHAIVGRVDVRGDERGRSLADVLAGTSPDAVIEFTTPSAARANIEAAIAAGVPVVSGTTGWDVGGIAPATETAGASVLVAANFSIGVAVLNRLAGQASAMLAAFEAFEPGIIEKHHRAKRDAPSGTARMLADVIAAARGAVEVPTVALRLGGQPGEHTVVFEGAAECVTLTHQARSRDVFAVGAVRAAEWLVRARPRGLVSFDTFLESTESWRQG